MGISKVKWEDFSKHFLKLYIEHLENSDFPQHNTKKLSKIENIIKKLKLNKIDMDKAVQMVALDGLNDVVQDFIL